jgi:hypothetical protein
MISSAIFSAPMTYAHLPAVGLITARTRGHVTEAVKAAGDEPRTASIEASMSSPLPLMKRNAPPWGRKTV